jgi:hypothetical protein
VFRHRSPSSQGASEAGEKLSPNKLAFRAVGQFRVLSSMTLTLSHERGVAMEPDRPGFNYQF